MNQRVLIAQASGTPIPTPSTQKVVAVLKPGSEQAITLDLGFDQNTKLDLSAVANEKMTLVHAGTKLIILFDNQSTVTIEPFFDSAGKPLTSFDVDLGGGRDLSGEQFASTFPITDDQSVLPAAGNGGGPSSGANFHDSSVDPLSTGNPLPLLGGETLGTFVTTSDIPPQAFQDFKPSVTGTFGTVVLLEADLDTNKDAPGAVGDLSQGYTVGTDAAGRGETIAVTGVTFSAGTQAIDVAFGATTGVTVKDGAGNPITVFWVSSQGGTHLEGFLTDPASEGPHHPAIVIEIVDTTDGTHATHANANGTVTPVVTITLTDQFPHSDTSHTGTADLVTITGITLVATDGTGDIASAPLPIQIADDAPIAKTLTTSDTLDDDAQTLFAGNPDGNGDVPDATFVSGVAGSLFVAGADHFKSLTFTPPEGLKAIYQDTNGFAGQETLVYTPSLSGGHTILTAAGSISGNIVFTLDVAPDGSYTYTEFKPLVQSAHNVSEGLAVEETEGVTIGFTVTDGDGDHSAGSLTVNVNDDTPTAHVVTATPVLDDDAQTLFHGNPGGVGDVNNATSTSGVAGALFTAGADGLQSIAFTKPAGLKAIYKDSHTGLALQETLHYTTQTHADNAAIAEGHTVYTAIGDSSSHVVFTLDVAADGSYTFDLKEPLVQTAHDTTHSGRPVEETQGITIGFTVTDGDNDTSSGSLTINVNDDTPVIRTVCGSNSVITLTANENDILTPWSQGTSPYDGTKDGSGTELFTGAAIVSGSLSTIVSAGADGLKSYGFISDQAAIQYFQSLQLYSKQTALPENGLQLTYTVTHVGHDVILTANEPDTAGFGNTGNPVFSFTLDTQTGDFTFRLFDELIHVKPGTPGADSDFDLRSGPVVNGVQHFISGLDFGHIIKVTDGDGDTITLDKSVIIKIHDDAPIADIGLRSENVTIDETPGLQKDDTNSSSVKALFTTVANSGDDPEVSGSGAINFARSGSPVVVNNSTIGADAPGLLQHFTLAIHNTQNPDSGLTLTDGTKISLSIDSSGRIIGVVGNDLLHPEFTGQTAFAIAIDDNGYISVAQYLSLHNPTGGSSYDETVNLAGKIDAILTITDSDGDTDTDKVGVGANIKFADDGPSVSVDRAEDSHHKDISLATLTLDETIGTKAGDSNASSDDNGVTQVSLLTTPDSSKAIGIVSTPDSHHAGTSVAELFDVSINGGADGVASTTNVYSLTLTGSNGSVINTSGQSLQSSSAVKTTLVVTQLAETTLAALSDTQRTVYLFKESDGTILGRIGSSVSDAADGEIALRIKLSGTGADTKLVVEQYLPIEHGNTSLSDDPALLQLVGNNSSLGITLTTTVTDGDDDVASDSKTVTIADNDGSIITIQDDGPTVTIAATSATVVHDETPGVQSDASGQNDISGSLLPPGVLNQFNAVKNPGVDNDVPNKDNNAIGFAISTASLVNVSAVYGTDSHALTNAQVLSLAINGGNGADSGLKTTDGHAIKLFVENGLIVGRYDGPQDSNTTVTNGPNTNNIDPAAFAIAIGQDGKVSVVQYVSLYNPTGGASYDEPAVGLKNILATVTVTDGDGDKSTASVDISANIKFQDDGPTLTLTVASAAHGLDFGNFDPNGNVWGNGSGTATGTTASWNIANSDTGQGGSGAVQLERVGDGYLGMHSSTKGYMVDLDASPHDVKITQVLTGLTNGQSYDLRFEAGAPYPGSAHLEVWFGGSLVGNISPTGQMTGYVITLVGGSGVNHDNLLEFRETGVPDNQGTYIANVSVGGIVIDETPVYDADSNEVAANSSFNAVANHGVDPDMVAQFAKGTAAVVSVSANFGADGPFGGSASAATAYSISTAANHTDSGLATTAGKEIFLFNETYNGVTYVVGRYDSNNSGSVDNTGYQNGTVADAAAFAFRIDPATGVLSVVQYVSLNHPNASSNDEGVFLNTGSLSVSVTITDGDSDTMTQTADITASIRFDDDGPSASLVATNATLVIDETAGDQSGTNDTLDAANTPVPAAFSGLGTPIEIAQSNAAVVTAAGSIYGADGKGAAPVFSLNLSSGNGVDSGLDATDGRSIFLFKEGNIIVGREGTVLDAADSNGNVVFAVALDSATGVLTVAEYIAIHHPVTTDPNDALSLGNNVIQATVTITDGDLDTSVASVGIGSQITFLDDGPSVAAAPLNQILNGTFTDGAWSAPVWWGSSSTSVDNWTINPSPVEPGTTELGRSPDGYLDMHSSTGGYMIDMGSSPGNITLTQSFLPNALVAGQTYAIQFEAGAPFPETAKLQVLWDGQVIGTIDPSGPGNLTSYNYIVTANGTAGDVLTFREIGRGDAPVQGNWEGNSLLTEGYHGTYLANIGLVATYVVDEDGLSKGNHDLPVPSEGDAAGLATSVTGALGINWGADNYDSPTADTLVSGHFVQDNNGTILTGRNVVFTDNSVGVSGASGLTSNGDIITVTSSDFGTRLIGTAVHDGVPRVVFEVSLSDDGSGKFNFVLKDSLDHAPNGSENDINLTFKFTATDSDGDSVQSTFTVGIDDDVPVIGTPQTVNLNEASLIGGSASGNHGTQIAVGSLHISWGADNGDAKHVTFTKDDHGNFTGPALTSNGVGLEYVIASTDPAGNEQLFAYRVGDAHTDDNLVLSITLYSSDYEFNGGGYYAVGLYQPIDQAGQGTDIAKLTFGITAYDSDGDGVQTTFDVNITDDVSHPAIAATGTTLIIDETAGDQSGTNDVFDLANTPVPAAFASLPGTPIEVAQSAGAVVSYSGTYGADGPGATPPAISLSVSSTGVWSGLIATDGQKIFLYQEGDLIIGREGVGGVADAGGSIAFAISIDSATGVVTIAEYTAIHHDDPLDSNESASPLTIAPGVLLASVTFTDGDNDHVTSTPVSIGGQIQFLDDGPSISAPVDLIVNGSFELGHGDLQSGQWSIYHSLPGWTSVNQPVIGDVPFEIQSDGAGGVSPQEGHAIVELDSDLNSGNLSGGDHFNATSNTNAIIQQTVGTQAGQTYELTFWYTPRPGEGGQDSGGMNVLWNGATVQAFSSDNIPEGQWQQYHVFVVGTGSDTLGFQGVGNENTLGALLDNVSLIPIAVVDEDGLSKALHGDAVTGNNDSQPGDAVVPNNDNAPASGGDSNEATATGLLAINWGADNFNGGTDGYSAANGFTQDGSGRSVTFTNKTVGITGGTLTSHGDTITFDWSSDHTKLIGTATHGNDTRTVIEVTLSDDGTGAFHVILHDALDHTQGGSENDIVLSFNYTATDSDGDFVTGAFNVLVDDDVPVLTGNLVAAGVVNESAIGSTTPVVQNLTLNFQSDTINQFPNLAGTHLQITGGTGIAVVQHDPGVKVLQGPDAPGGVGASPLVITADAGTTFVVNSLLIGTFGTGPSPLILKAYDAAGNLIATSLPFAPSTLAYVSQEPSAAFTAFNNLSISKLEIIPPASGFNGRIVIDNLSITETTIPAPHPAETLVDLTSLVSVGADSPGVWTLTQFTGQPVTFTQGAAVGPATYGGVPITMTSDGHTITGVAGATTIFTLVLSADGHATFDLFKPIDGGTLRTLDFSQFVTVTDSDGDGLTLPAGDLVINVNSTDHAPAVSAAPISVNESGLPVHDGLPSGTATGVNVTHTGTIAVDPGDGPSTVTINGIAVTGVGQIIDGLNHFGALIITSISPTEIGYSYTLATNSNGEGTHDDFSIVVTDNDHQTATSTLVVNIVDDAPEAHADSGIVNEGVPLAVSATFGVLSNDSQGADGVSIVGVRAAGGDTTTAVTNALVGTDITGEHGILNLHADGSYTYQSFADGVSSDTNETFVYTIRDADGDESTATLTITINDANISAATSTATVDEAALDTFTTGSDLAAGSITGTLGTTSAAETDASQHVSATGGFGGLTYALVSGGNAATAGTYGTIQLDANGNYIYTLTSPVHGFTPNNSNDTVPAADHFTYIATDAYGNTATGTINIDIVDDVPTANNVAAWMSENDIKTVTLVEGTDFVYGADGAAASAALTLGTISVTGDYVPPSLSGLDIALNGTDIVIKPGTTFDPLNNGQSSVIHIQYSVTDGDGDVTTKEVAVTVNGVTDNQAPEVHDNHIIANAYSYTGNSFQISIPIAGLLWGIHDPEGSAVSLVGGSLSNGATISGNNILYTVVGASGSQTSFTYDVTDGTNVTHETAYVTRYDDAMSNHVTNGDEILINRQNDGAINFSSLDGNDVIVGGVGNSSNTLAGGDGNDLIFGATGTGFNTLHGNNGNDVLYGGNGQNNNLFGDAGNDTLYAGVSGQNKLTGGSGSDTLYVTAGATTLTLTGGDTGVPDSDSDHFVFMARSSGTVVHITDFASGTDSIDVLLSAFTGLSGTGGITANQFANSTNPSGATVAGDVRFIYQQSSGELYYDSDGGGNANRVLLATLDNHIALQATDIHKV